MPPTGEAPARAWHDDAGPRGLRLARDRSSHDPRMEPYRRFVLRRHPEWLGLREPKRFQMKIRAGYEISYDCPQPTPMILTLSVHPSRTPDLLSWDRMRLDPPIPVNTYHDSFGNFCHVIRAPAGRLTVSADFQVADRGEPDAIAPGAARPRSPGGRGGMLWKPCRWRS